MTHIQDKNIIQHFIFEVNASGVANPLGFQEEVVSFLREHLLFRTEKVLDNRQMDANPARIRLDSISLDLGNVSYENWEEEVLTKFMTTLQQQLVLVADRAPEAAPHSFTAPFDAALFFLQNGYIPWWGRKRDWDMVLEQLIRCDLSQTEVQTLLAVLRSAPQALDRLINQAGESKMLKIVPAITNYSLSWIHVVAGLIATTPANQSSQNTLSYWAKKCIQSFLMGNPAPQIELELLQEALSQLFPPNEIKRFKKTVIASNADKHSAVLPIPATPLSVAAVSTLFLACASFVYRQPLSGIKKKYFKAFRKIAQSAYSRIWAEHNFSRGLTAVIPGIIAQISSDHVFLESYDSEKDTDSYSSRDISASSQPDELLALVSEGQLEHQSRNREVVNLEPNLLPKSAEPEIYIDQAGLILLHPFLPEVFQRLNWLEEEQFKNVECQKRAVHLLYFLATGLEQEVEYKLTLPKLLCGVDHDFPIDRYISLGHQEKEEGLSMLDSVLEHWGALRNTDIQSFRESFLMRTGKLTQPGHRWTLIVEQQTVDILLSKLPWGIGIVKLAWMPKMIETHWI